MEPLEISTATWAMTLGFILALFAFDLIYSTRRPHEVGFKEAVGWSVFYIAVAIGFGLWFTSWAGGEFGAQYFAGYIVEKSLSVDNLFVFVIIMTHVRRPEDAPAARLLTFGILLALVFRAIFIALGATLLEAFAFMFLVFGAILIFTGVKLFQHRNEDPEINDNALVRVTRRDRSPSPTSTTAGASSPGSTASAWPHRSSWPSSRSAARTCCSRWTRSRPCSA